MSLLHRFGILCIACAAWSTAAASPRALIVCFSPISSSDKNLIRFCATVDQSSHQAGTYAVSSDTMKRIVALAFSGVPVPGRGSSLSYAASAQAQSQPDVAMIDEPSKVDEILGEIIAEVRSTGAGAPPELCVLRKYLETQYNSG